MDEATVKVLENRVNELEKAEHSSAQIFQSVCLEFNLDPEFYTLELGCECPFGLIGYLAESVRIYGTI